MEMVLIVLSLSVVGALAEAQFLTYITTCDSENEPVTGRVEGILIPPNLNPITDPVVNVNFYFPGLNWDNGPIGKYVEEMGLLEAASRQSPSGEVIVLFAGANNHKGDVANQWMDGTRKETKETQFNCFYQEALNKIVEFGFNPKSISFFGHSNGVHVIKNIMDSGFLDEGEILPIKDIVSFDGCYGEWCTDIEDKFAERGNLVSIYAYYLKGSAANSKTDTETNAKALVEKYPPISSVFEFDDSAHNDVPQECLFSHVVGDSCGGKAIRLSLTERASQTSATTTPDSIEASIPLPPPKEGISDRAREIDRVWKDIGPRIRGSTDVWDTYLNMWVAFEYLYPSATLSALGFQTVTVPARAPVQSTAPDKTQCLIDNFGWYGSGNKEPPLATVTLGGKSFKANAQIVAAIQNVAPVIESSGYKIQSVVGACRPQKEGNALQPPDCGSLHVSCLAIDINPLRNPHCPSWADKLSTPDERARCQRGEIVTDLPPQVINAFEENGFYWGGRFGSSTGKPTPDAMHFEYVGKPGDTTICCSRQYSALTYSYGMPAGTSLAATSTSRQYDGYIRPAALQFQVQPGLIKALMYAESRFDPNAPDGGLMQVEKFGEKYGEMIEEKPELSTLPKNVYDPKTNIYVGAYVFFKMGTYLQKCRDLGCQIAAYNLGQAPVNTAAEQLGGSPSWSQVYTKFKNNHSIIQNTFPKWSPEEVTRRITDLGPYVDGIIANSNKYQADFA